MNELFQPSPTGILKNMDAKNKVEIDSILKWFEKI